MIKVLQKGCNAIGTRKNRQWQLAQSLKQGFTLVEILIASAVASIIFFGAIQTLMGYLSSSARQEAILRLQDNWIRAHSLIDQDIEEGSGACFSAASQMKIFGIQGSAQEITYTLNSAGELVRVGPTITSDGSLNLSSIDSGGSVVTPNVITFTNASASAPTSCTSSTAIKNIAYTLSLRHSGRMGIQVRYSNQGRIGSGYSRIAPIN